MGNCTNVALCVCFHSELLVEGALTALRKNEMHLPKPSKLTGRRHQVRLSVPSSSLCSWCVLVLNVWADLCFSSCRITSIRNRATVKHILRNKWLRFGEVHYTLSLHNWSMLILVWSSLCVHSYRMTTKKPCFCEMHSVQQVIETWWGSLYTTNVQLKHVNSESMSDL